MKDVFLRGYQLFGAKFSVVQRRVLLGDEMGLGKTLQAIAAAAHVSAGLQARAEVARVLVVVPASLLLNWKRELAKFSLMSTFVAHGAVREAAVHAWRREGGVLVTTFDTLKTLDVGQPQMVIVDEAHMVKNPAAQRTVAVRGVLAGAEYALMMTGTPLENRREEFATLVSFLDEQVGKEAARQVAPSEFRKAISPVYLRRNQVDVLDELPQKVENEEWVELNAADQQRYFEAIRQGAWMAARRAAIVADGSQNSAPTSAKLERIRELVDEAHEDGKNVLIFSYFRDVLDLLAREFQAVSVGTIDGSVPPARRQEYVDALGKAGHVLLAQITAGGVGLNIQQASVVIFTEVQVKPSLEDQAVARAHRMGQMEVVQVHRIIGDDTVDERLLEVTAEKRAVFDEFARLANSAQVSDAKDVSEIKIAQEIIKAERERLRISDATVVTIEEG
ncbi:DEAD/DEAH box helicase [Corynebacterium sp. 153RC1]|nr:DEAD/DEAH box helicase [Corynebacterium sp. 209RC1]MCQ9354530.1 DEAD/DEAH box helicase [Corynebacterium sp. 1222RC1]MCQ9356076.1 DEAD/DEAH box helicase [Corynebacterium sp. 122RC1]MCQ9358708.1 DEAD/DEAH box helicase [Corynebacterium sp. 142RC1]MCQ9360690.1 DEAD/DEAH box helicase [Corynebacterium sp. 153RC1]MCQ9363214.1 DEAD/DEAH box helicase [Corynebacterium sp. 732RC1]MCQ9364517.1 DEAD/DEAH box helicase [Corynebacterium sp. 70RC1]MCQ9370507.1 DEAD/DEAH box helicase [Corynebacterium sp. 3